MQTPQPQHSSLDELWNHFDGVKKTILATLWQMSLRSPRGGFAADQIGQTEMFINSISTTATAPSLNSLGSVSCTDSRDFFRRLHGMYHAVANAGSRTVEEFFSEFCSALATQAAIRAMKQ